MVVFFRTGGGKQHLKFRRPFLRNKSGLGDDLRFHQVDLNGLNPTKHVVIVMDGLKEFTTELLIWVLQNLITSGCVITLLGVMPWLNIPC